MNDQIYLIDENEELRTLEAMQYDSEALLQRLIAEHPSLLPGYQIDPTHPRRWVLVKQEIGIPGEPYAGERWSLDHLFLDQDGKPTLIEVKRASDTRIRREVVGQLLDYAANAVLYWKPEEVRVKYIDTCKAKGQEPNDVLATLLNCSPDDENLMEEFWDKVFTRLKTGEIRLIFVADEIPDKLARIIEFMDLHMSDVDVVGVALPQYFGDGIRTIVPRVVGRTATAERIKKNKQPKKLWNYADFFKELAQNGEVDTGIAQAIYDWTIANGLELAWGEGSKWGTFAPLVNVNGRVYKPFLIWTSNQIQFYFGSCPEPFKSNGTLRKLLADLNNALPKFKFNLDEDLEKYPYRILTRLNNENALKRFLEIYEHHVRETQDASVPPTH